MTSLMSAPTAELSVTLVAVMAFATYRLTRLALYDTIFERPRDAFYDWLNRGVTQTQRTVAAGMLISAAAWLFFGALSVVTDRSDAFITLFFVVGAAFTVGAPLVGFRFWLFTLVTCQWCLGVWIAAAVTAVTAFVVDGVPVVVWGLVWMAVAAVQSLLHLIEDALSEYVGAMSRRREADE